jgi:hypothetical protein
VALQQPQEPVPVPALNGSLSTPGRRGAATILTQLTGDALAAKELLGHANLSVTTAKYVKTMPEALLRGKKLLEEATK